MEQKKKMAESKAQAAIQKLKKAKNILKNNAALTRILREDVRPSPEKMASVGAYGASNEIGSVKNLIDDDFHNEEDKQLYRDNENRVAWMDFENPYQHGKYHLKGLRCETDCGKKTTTFFESPSRVQGKCNVKGFTNNDGKQTHSVTCEHAPSPIRKLGLLKSLAVAWPTGIAKMKAAQIRQEKEKWVARANEKQAFAHENNLELLVENFSESESVKALKKAVEAYEKRVDDAYEAQQAAFGTQISEWKAISDSNAVSESVTSYVSQHYNNDAESTWSSYLEAWRRFQTALTSLPENKIPHSTMDDTRQAIVDIRGSVLTALEENTAERIREAKSENDQLRKDIEDTYGQQTDETTEDMPLKEHERRTGELNLKKEELASQLAKKVQRKRTEYEQLKAITLDSPVADGSLHWREYSAEYNKWHNMLGDSMFDDVRTVATYKALVQRLENIKNAQEEAVVQVLTLELTSVRKNSALQKYNKLSELTLSAEDTYTDNGNTYPKKVWDAWHVTFAKMNAEETTLGKVSNMVSEFLFSTLNIAQAKPVYSLLENMKNGDIGQVLGKLRLVLTLKHDAEKAYMHEQDAVRREEIAQIKKASLEASPGPEFNNAVTQQVESLHQQSAEIVKEAASNISSVPSAMYDGDTFNKLGEISKMFAGSLGPLPSLKKKLEDQ